VSVLAFQMSGRPGCLRLRPRVGAKLKDYTLAADTLAVSKQWADGLVAAGAQLVDSSDVSALEPRGVYGSVLYKLGGGALREWQPRFVCVEADGLLSYYEIKLRSNNRKEFYLRGTLQLPFCNVSKVDGDVKSVPAKHRYQLILKQQGGTKDKEYVWCGERHDVRDKWYSLAQEYGAVDLVHPNLVKPLLRTMPALPNSKRPTPRAADAPPPKPISSAAPAKPPLKTAASTPARPQTTTTTTTTTTATAATAAATRATPPPTAAATTTATAAPASAAASPPAALARAVSAATRPAMPTPGRAKPMPTPAARAAPKSAPSTLRDAAPVPETPAAAEVTQSAVVAAATTPSTTVDDKDEPPSRPAPTSRKELEARKAELAARKAALAARKATAATDAPSTGSLDRAVSASNAKPAIGPKRDLPQPNSARRHTSALSSEDSAKPPSPAVPTKRAVPSVPAKTPAPAVAAASAAPAAGTGCGTGGCGSKCGRRRCNECIGCIVGRC
jgi:hypothetical protein